MKIRVIQEGSEFVDFDSVVEFSFHGGFLVMYKKGGKSAFFNKDKISWFNVDSEDNE